MSRVSLCRPATARRWPLRASWLIAGCICGLAMPASAAITLNCGQTVTGSISAPGQTVEYTFEATKDDVVVVHLQQQGSSSSLWLHAEVTPLGGGTSQTAYEGQPKLITIASSGTYSLAVSDVMGTNTGSFGLNLQYTRDGGGRCAKTALACGVTASGSIATVADAKAYGFTAVPGDAVHARAVATSGSLGASVALFGPGGGELGSFSYSSSEPIQLTESGSFTIIVRDDGLTDTGNFLVDLQFTTGKCSKGTLACGLTQNGSLSSFGRDAFTFDAGVNEGLVFSVYAAEASSTLEAAAVLYGPDGKPVVDLSGWEWHSADRPYLTATGGRYTVLVRDDSSTKRNTGAYNLQLQRTNGVCGSIIGCGQTAEGSVGVRGGLVGYRFTGEASSVLMLKIAPKSGGVDPAFQVYGLDGSILGSVSSFGNTSASLGLPASGTYTVIAADYDWTAPSTGTFALDATCASAPTDFHAVQPCRAVDTRDAALGGPNPVTAGADQVFAIGGKCGIPSTAKAVSMNVTVTGSSGAGDLRFYPAGSSLPLVSLVNYSAGQTRANNGLVALGTDGGVVVHCDQLFGGVHVIMDVNGYFP